jgi:O-antigen ligase
LKYVFLAIALAGIFPLADWLRRNPSLILKVWTVVGLLPFILTAVPHFLFIAVISWAYWPGFVKGAEFSAIDVIALALLLSGPRTRFSLPFKAAFSFYVFTVMLSVLLAGVAEPVLFYLWQLGRMCLVFAVVTRACAADPRVASAIIKGMAIGVCIQCFFVIQQRFLHGVVQSQGTFAHQNGLGVATYLTAIPAFALLLAGKRGWYLYAAVGCGLLIGISTASRATIGLIAFGLGTVFLLSAVRQWTSVKARFAMLGVAGLVLLIPAALSSLETRFGDTSLFESYDDRAAYEAAASMMLADHPLGVGANNFVGVANNQGYFERAGVSYSASRGSSVHNAYWLAASETGYIGFVAFVFLLFQPLATAFRCGWRNRRDPRGDLLLGIAVALLTFYIHSMYEWIIFTFYLQYMLAMSIGMVAGTAIQLGYWRSGARNMTDVNQLAGQQLK